MKRALLIAVVALVALAGHAVAQAPSIRPKSIPFDLAEYEKLEAASLAQSQLYHEACRKFDRVFNAGGKSEELIPLLFASNSVYDEMTKTWKAIEKMDYKVVTGTDRAKLAKEQAALLGPIDALTQKAKDALGSGKILPSMCCNDAIRLRQERIKAIDARLKCLAAP